MASGEEFAKQFNSMVKGTFAILIALILLGIISIGANIYLWNKWQDAQEYISAKCQVSEGEYPVLIANDYHYCWKVENNGHKL